MDVIRNVEELRTRINQVIDDWADDEAKIEFTASEEPRETPKGKRVIRTKSTGDRVYVIDEVAKTKAWVTSPEILTKLGFELSDVEDVDDKDLLGYAMIASVYRVED